MKLTRYEGDRKTLRDFKKLYASAFPKEERKPFKMITKMHGVGRADMLKIEGDDGEFLGLAFTVIGKKFILLDYFAISEKERCRGYGRVALDLILKLYADLPVLIEIEDPNIESENTKERLRRLNFYKECGMKENPFNITLFGVDMITLSSGAPVSFEDYKNLYYTIVPKAIVDKRVLLR